MQWWAIGSLSAGYKHPPPSDQSTSPTSSLEPRKEKFQILGNIPRQTTPVFRSWFLATNSWLPTDRWGRKTRGNFHFLRQARTGGPHSCLLPTYIWIILHARMLPHNPTTSKFSSPFDFKQSIVPTYRLSGAHGSGTWYLSPQAGLRRSSEAKGASEFLLLPK